MISHDSVMAFPEILIEIYYRYTELQSQSQLSWRSNAAQIYVNKYLSLDTMGLWKQSLHPFVRRLNTCLCGFYVGVK